MPGVVGIGSMNCRILSSRRLVRVMSHTKTNSFVSFLHGVSASGVVWRWQPHYWAQEEKVKRGVTIPA